MRTAISIPDSVFEAAEQLAQRLGMSCSELYTTALSAYVAKHQHERVTEQLDLLYNTEDSSLDEIIQQLQLRSLPQEEC